MAYDGICLYHGYVNAILSAFVIIQPVTACKQKVNTEYALHW